MLLVDKIKECKIMQLLLKMIKNSTPPTVSVTE